MAMTLCELDDTATAGRGCLIERRLCESFQICTDDG